MGVAEGAAFAHQRIHAIQRGAFAVGVVEDLLHRGEETVVGSGRGRGAEVDRRAGGKFGGEEESSEGEELFRTGGAGSEIFHTPLLRSRAGL
ncbi:hypothetical protein EV701_10783 [Chthoniobacter flavus]|uniref:hypothetical protein n=1 Tax=Chthoniobacter flavus TaxID=191863 RepID=UPI0010E0A297|nr:hypothetical protein [Chthoniobacter flavus]TCO91802.1 hypothetical protein EV701_10783 [Chthoniobacter flavus]